jgi:hypothetical protein
MSTVAGSQRFKAEAAAEKKESGVRSQETSFGENPEDRSSSASDLRDTMPQNDVLLGAFLER